MRSNRILSSVCMRYEQVLDPQQHRFRPIKLLLRMPISCSRRAGIDFVAKIAFGRQQNSFHSFSFMSERDEDSGMPALP